MDFSTLFVRAQLPGSLALYNLKYRFKSKDSAEFVYCVGGKTGTYFKCILILWAIPYKIKPVFNFDEIWWRGNTHINTNYYPPNLSRLWPLRSDIGVIFGFTILSTLLF